MVSSGIRLRLRFRVRVRVRFPLHKPAPVSERGSE